MNKKEWGIVAIVTYVLSLPVMIWKSSKIGKIVFAYLSILLCLFLLSRVVDPIYKAYVKFQVIKTSEPILKDLQTMKLNAERLKTIVENGERDLRELVATRQAEIKQEIYDKLQKPILDSLIKDTDELSLIERNIIMIKEDERNRIKELIYDIREKIKIQKKSIDEKDVRKVCEEITSSTELLTKEEKSRLWDSLEELGFGINKLNNDMVIVYGGNYMTASGCAVMPSYEIQIPQRRR